MTPHEWLDRVLLDNADAEPGAWIDVLWPVVRSTDFVGYWLKEKLALMARHPATLPGGYADGLRQSLVLLDDGRVHLSLVIVSAAEWRARTDGERINTIIDFADGWTRLRFLVADDVTVQRHYRAADDDTRRASADPPQRVQVGQEFVLDNASEALRLIAVGADVVMLRLVERDPVASRAIECDADSGAVLRIRQAQSCDGRTRMTLSLLRSLGVGDALGVIANKLPHWPPHLRWHGVMEALALDSHDGFALLEAMVRNDPDISLRKQARQTRTTLLARYPELRG